MDILDTTSLQSSLIIFAQKYICINVKILTLSWGWVHSLGISYRKFEKLTQSERLELVWNSDSALVMGQLTEFSYGQELST